MKKIISSVMIAMLLFINMSDVFASGKTDVEPQPQTVGVYTQADGNDFDLIQGYYTYENSTTCDTFFYSDGYFAESPSKYNEHMATTSSNIMAASGYLEDVDYQYKSTPLRQIFSDIGIEDEQIYMNDCMIEKPTSDSIGYMFGNKELDSKIKNSSGENYNMILVAVRSIGYESEWANNVKIADDINEEATGFSDSAKIIYDDLCRYIKDYGLQDKIKNGQIKLWICGFSRGGAVANILSKMLTDEFCNPLRYNKGNEVYGYCQATPMGGAESKKVRESYTDNGEYHNIHNIINVADLVTYVIPQELGFIRYGVDHYVPGAEAVTTPSKQNAAVSGLLSDNKSLEYKVGATNQSYENSEYYTRRNVMVNQFKAVNPDMVFDDGFSYCSIDYPKLILSGATENLIMPVSPNEANMGNVNVSGYIKQFWKQFLAWTGIYTKADYTKPVTIKSNTGAEIGGISFQEALRVFFYAQQGLNDDKKSALSSCLDKISITGGNALNATSIEGIMVYDSMSDNSKYNLLEGIWNSVDTEKLKEEVGEEFAEQLHKAAVVILDITFKFVNQDLYHTGGGEKFVMFSGMNNLVYLSTLIYNFDKIAMNHEAPVYISWLRTYDDFYMSNTNIEYLTPKNNSLKTYKLKKPNTISSPSIIINDTSLSDGETFSCIGACEVVLDNDELRGETIYFDLTVIADGEMHILPDLVYNGKFTLSNLMANGTPTTYTITPHSSQHQVQSKKVKYSICIN